MSICRNEWQDLRRIRLDSLLDAPEAFSVSYQDALDYTQNDWEIRASQDGEPRFFIAYQDENPVGLVGGIFSNQEYELISMWVSPAYRALGVARLLVNRLKEHATSEKHIRIVLKVSSDNKVARGFYSKYGFKNVDSVLKSDCDYDFKLQKMEFCIRSKKV